MEFPSTTTNITVEWLNEVLHANGFLGDTNVVSLQHEQMGIGRGYLSDMAKLTLQYDNGTSDLPRTIVAKLPPSSEIALAGIKQLNLFERETRFYQEIAPECNIRTPQIYFTAIGNDQEFVILMEDCSRYLEIDPQMQGITYQYLETIALKIADFHASWWDSKKIKSLSWIPTIKDIIYMLPPIKDLWDACNKKESFIEALPEGGWEVGTKVVENYLWVIDNFATDMITLVHNDLKSENMFFDVDTPENPLIIFDWSVMNINRGVTDLSLLLAGSVLSDVRYDIEGDILKLYYDRLLSNGIINYSFEECHTDYLKGLLTLTFLPLIVNSRPDLNDPRSVQKNRNGVNRWFSALIDNDAISLLP